MKWKHYHKTYQRIILYHSSPISETESFIRDPKVTWPVCLDSLSSKWLNKLRNMKFHPWKMRIYIHSYLYCFRYLFHIRSWHKAGKKRRFLFHILLILRENCYLRRINKNGKKVKFSLVKQFKLHGINFNKRNYMEKK